MPHCRRAGGLLISHDVFAHIRLLWEDTCEAREIDVAATVYEAVQSRVEAMCDSQPGCIYLSIEDHAAAMALKDDPTRNCAASLIAVRCTARAPLLFFCATP
jgi:hypothetical protein